jgi:ribose/xylose/arabinose/galactoside ABC-type transport system permease subunit
MSSKNLFKNLLVEYFIIILYVVIFIGLGLNAPQYFFTYDAVMNILVYFTSLLILSLAQSIVVITGNIDLSIVGVAGFAAYIGWLLNVMHKLPVFIVFPIMILTGAAWGAFNGFMVRKIGVPALVQTLSVMFILYGFLLVVTGGTSLGGFSPDYVWLGSATILGIRVIVLVVLPLICLLGLYLLHLSRFGLRLFFTGGNPNAAFLVGINVDKTTMLAFTLSGALSALAGFVTSSRIGIITTQFGRELLMPSIAAPVIGGVSLSGGEGNLIGIIFGTLLMQTISTGLVAIGVSAWYIDMVNGIIILAAIAVDAIKRQRLLRA